MRATPKKRPVFLAIRPSDRWDETRVAFSGVDVDLEFIETLRYAPVPVDLPDSASYDGLIISSARSLILNEKAQVTYRDLPLYVVGERTGERLMTLGMGPLMACAPTGEALVSVLRKTTNQRYLYLSGDRVALDFSEHIPCVDRHITYKTTATEIQKKDMMQKIKNADLKAVLFFSRQTAEAFSRQISDLDLSSAVPLLSALCLSQPVLECVKDLPWAQTKVAPTPDLAGMVAVASCAL